MTDDKQLAEQKITQLCTTVDVQWGQSLTMSILPGTGANVANVAKDVVRWKGRSISDVQPCRLYLGPYQPNPNLQAPDAIFPGYSYQQPTPWQEPQPKQYDAMVEPELKARISFGGGGVQHQAYVDWPPRGCLVQVSANYIQVDGVALFVSAGGPIDPTSLPRIAAHIAPEPGGGDSALPATFTYKPQDFNNNPGAAPGVLFQVPPFARQFRPILDAYYANQTSTSYLVTVIGSNQKWLIDGTADFNAFNRDDFPIDGNGTNVFIQAVDITTGNFATTINVGCMFILDL